MKKLFLGVAVLATAFAIVPAALADSFTFTFTSNGAITATGTLTGVLDGSAFDITSGTIDVVGGPITGDGTLLANPNFPGTTTNTTLAGGGTYLTYDDALSPGSNPQLDGNGLLFAVDGTAVNLWGDGPNTYEAFGGNYAFDEYGVFSATDVPAAAPEPSSFIMLGSGLLAAAGMVRRRLMA